MKVTVTLVGGVAVDLDGTEAEVAKWERAVQGKQRTFSGRFHGGRRIIVAEAVTCLTVHDGAPTTPAPVDKGRRR